MSSDAQQVPPRPAPPPVIVPPHIETLAPYEPGKPIEELERELGIRGVIKLASNENPLGPSPRAIEAARRALVETSRYPDGGGFRLRGALAARLGVAPEEVILGSGSNDLIDLAVRAFCRPAIDVGLTHAHAFVMFAVAAQASGVRVIESRVDADLNADMDDLIAHLGPTTRLVYLPHPNNPTGAYLPAREVERLIAHLPDGAILVIDEAYHEYARARPGYLLGERARAAGRARVVIMRTFSKVYGLAGFRLGYAVADRDVVGYMNRVRLPFNTTSLAQEAGLAALEDEEHVARSVAANERGLEQLRQGLAGLPVRVYPSAGNFLLVDVRRDAGPVYQALLRCGIIVRPLRPYRLPTHLRVSVGTPEENERAIAAFARVLAA